MYQCGPLTCVNDADLDAEACDAQLRVDIIGARCVSIVQGACAQNSSASEA